MIKKKYVLRTESRFYNCSKSFTIRKNISSHYFYFFARLKLLYHLINKDLFEKDNKARFWLEKTNYNKN